MIQKKFLLEMKTSPYPALEIFPLLLGPSPRGLFRRTPIPGRDLKILPFLVRLNA